MFGVPGFRSLHRRVVTATLAGAALTAATLVAETATATSAGAQPVTVNFNTLTDPMGAGVRYVDNCYTESGFTVTAVGVGCGTMNTFATGSAASPGLFTGSPSLFLNSETATQVDFARAGGGLFSMQSIALAPYFGAGATVGFTGFFANGASVFQAFTVAAGSPFAVNPTRVFAFASTFAGLTAVRMTALDTFNEPVVLFDDVTFTPAATAVPEPTTVVLLGAGLLAVGAAARRRRAASALNA